MAAVNAQEIVLKAEYPSVVTAGEQFSITWSINAECRYLTAPQFTGFYKIMGPQTSFSSNTAIVNGRISKQESWSYTYYLQAVNEGKYVLPPAVATIKNKEYRSDSLRIEVISDSRRTAPDVQGAGQDNQAPAADFVPNSDLFIRLIPSKTELYQGEHMVVTVKLYSRIDLAGLNEIKLPDFKGFLREDLETPALTSLQRENVGGTIYGTGVIQQFLLYPQQTGELNIDPVEITVLIQQKIGNPDPFFGDFFSSYRNVQKMLASKPLKIAVRALPEPKPADFSGIVGKIGLKASMSRDSVNVNDAVNYRVTLSGSGNLRLAGTPRFKMPPDVELFEPKVTDNIRNSSTGTTGEKTFEYVLIPRHYGDFKIPSFSYTFFNPASGKYETLTAGEFAFHARKGTEEGGAVAVYGGVSKEDVKYLGKDIRFIKSQAGTLRKPVKSMISGKGFFSIYGIAAVVFAAVLIIRREHVRRNADIMSVKNRRAARIARKRLAEASKWMKSGMTDKFHDEILKALWGYLSDKLSIPVAELNRSSAVEALTSKGINSELIGNLSTLLDKCEFARFAPSSSESEEEEIYSGAAGFISSVENLI